MSSSNSFMIQGHGRLPSIAALLIISILAGCGDQKKPATQVAAKVGSDEITISQVNNVFTKVPVVPGKSADQVKHEVLENLINQQLLISQAIDKKLDREPAVMQAIEESKRSILANAYMDRLRTGIPNASAGEISKYYGDHPELFAQRRIFNLRELDVAAQAGLADTLRDEISRGATLDTLAVQLKNKNIPFSTNTSTHMAEETPFDVLSKISMLKDGQLTVLEINNALSVLQLVASKSAPVDEKTASASIQQYLNNKRLVEEIDKEVKSLRKSVKVDYFGEFMAGAGATHTPAEVPGKPAEQSSSPDVAKAVASLK